MTPVPGIFPHGNRSPISGHRHHSPLRTHPRLLHPLPFTLLQDGAVRRTNTFPKAPQTSCSTKLARRATWSGYRNIRRFLLQRTYQYISLPFFPFDLVYAALVVTSNKDGTMLLGKNIRGEKLIINHFNYTISRVICACRLWSKMRWTLTVTTSR